MFDVNDFDETLPGPWEWDVKRLAASLEIAGRNNGFTDAERRTVVLAGARHYRTSMAEFASMPNLEVWYAHLDIAAALRQVQSRLDRKRTKAVEKDLAKARARDNVQAFAKLTDEEDAEPKIASNPPLIVPIEELLPNGVSREEVTKELLQLVRKYRGTLETDRRYLLEQFRFVHLARKVVGVGSVGTRAWIALFLGRDNQDPLFLQIKEAQDSVLERFVGKSAYPNHGQRVVAGQRLMQGRGGNHDGADDSISGLSGPGGLGATPSVAESIKRTAVGRRRSRALLRRAVASTTRDGTRGRRGSRRPPRPPRARAWSSAPPPRIRARPA